MSRFIPNSFQIPNAIIDEYLDKISGNAFKCYALIARQTTGWGKVSDRISISQFMVKCNIKDKKTAHKVLAELEEINLIFSYKKQGEITEFSLNFEFENPEKEPVPKNGTSTKNSLEPVPKNGTSTSTKNWYPTKNNIKNNIQNNTLTGINARAKKTSQSAVEILKDFGIEGQLADDFITHRKACKATITKTALDGFQREADKAGIPIQEAVAISIERGWRGFKASWDWHGEGAVRGERKMTFAEKNALPWNRPEDWEDVF